MDAGTVARAGMEMHFVSCGWWPVLILLHGLAGEPVKSGQFASTMGELSGSFQIVALNQ